jgi:hypothetical protein
MRIIRAPSAPRTRSLHGAAVAAVDAAANAATKATALRANEAEAGT